MEHIKIVLDWFPNTNHTGLLLAKKRGWFEKEGLDVEIDGKVHGSMELHGADMICGPEISMLDCMERGIGLTCIAVYTQKCDSGIVSLKEAGITRPRELMGKRLTHWSPAWYHKAIGKLVNEDGGDYDKVIKVQMDVGDIVSTLGSIADATWVYENWENYELLQAGKEINYFNLGDCDPIFDFCAPAIAATHEILNERPEAVKTFLRLTDLGYREAAAHPEEAVMEVKEFMPATAGDKMLIESQKHLAPILLDERGHWGTIKPERWNRMAEFILECGVITSRKEKEFTNEFLPE